ncbi:MAG TPA: hypothetical protein VF221_10500, partial [Chloroflexota bacterium]
MQIVARMKKTSIIEEGPEPFWPGHNSAGADVSAVGKLGSGRMSKPFGHYGQSHSVHVTGHVTRILLATFLLATSIVRTGTVRGAAMAAPLQVSTAIALCSSHPS